ncbi:MAG: type II toxin-antitoxin system RelE/ParE family toxin [Planctomycetota bacterium]
MTYRIKITPPALKDLGRLTPSVASRVVDKIEQLKEDLSGDVKRLKNHQPRYRLRVGDWRGLFDVEKDVVFVYRVLHRSSSY